MIQLKRCKQTYLRQATKIPNLTKETIKNVNKEDLTRYNRSYQVFKSMRGTSMYYEEAKKNVMALLRQNGSPSLFLTLSCAEYSWDSLFKEILETIKPSLLFSFILTSTRCVSGVRVSPLIPAPHTNIFSRNIFIRLLTVFLRGILMTPNVTPDTGGLSMGNPGTNHEPWPW